MSFFFAGCAAQGPPGGGPADETGPALISVFPENGATNVPGVRQITFSFSELIDPRSAENSLVVTPTLEREPVVKVNQKKIVVEFDGPLLKETTYILSFGRNLRDYQKNSTESSITLAFSTGDSLDQGQITGTVFGIPEKLQAQVWAYRKAASFPDSILGSNPDYRTVTDRDGHYRLSNLAKGEYRLLAIASKTTCIPVIDENVLLAVPQLDSISITRRDMAVTGVTFKLAQFYTTPFRLQKALQHGDKIDLVFSRPLDDKSAAAFRPWIDGARIRSFWVNENDPQHLLLITDSLTHNREYAVGVDSVYDNKRNLLTGNNMAFFTYTESQDTLPPALLSSQPSSGARNVRLDSEIYLDFSEAMNRNIPDSSIILLSADSTLTKFNSQWWDSNTLQLSPVAPLAAAMEYRLLMDCSAWLDLAGVRFRDSLQTITFTTVDANSFGSISGKVISPGIAPQKMVLNCYREKENHPVSITPSASGDYVVNSLLPGRYRFEIWVDRNDNGRWDQGSLMPYKAAEPYRVYPDWINVRARWETAEVDWIY